MIRAATSYIHDESPPVVTLYMFIYITEYLQQHESKPTLGNKTQMANIFFTISLQSWDQSSRLFVVIH